jgi:hypothetical protein
VNFPHLLWAITNWGPHYKLARAIGCSESRLSRCLYGRSTFTDEERTSIGRVLCLSEKWLFEQVEPPAPTVAASLIHAHA